MPYFIYKMLPNKKLEQVAELEKFRAAKWQARDLRAAMSAEDDYQIKIIFAKNSMEAQLLLKEERQPRPLGDD